MKKENFVIGVDFGTDSVRSVIVDATNGEEIASSVFFYPRWREGLYCNPSINQFRQHPKDYVEGLEYTIGDCLKKAGKNVSAFIRAISVDTTGSTPVAVDRMGTPLALLPGFEDNPDAMFILWKDHTAVREAAEINSQAEKYDINYLQFVGGIYSSEWFWAKLLHILRSDISVRSSCFSWVEHCDWIPFLLTGGTNCMEMKRSVCAAGHKALWAAEFGGLPPDSFFSSIDEVLRGFVSHLFESTYTSDQAAGHLSAEWAQRLGLSTDVIIGVGAFDAHMGAAGGQIEPYHLSKVMGTSTCDMLVAPLSETEGTFVKGICGQVPGSIIPGMMGLEAGQSAFGDSYAWFSSLLAWPLQQVLPESSVVDPPTAKKLQEEISGRILSELTKQASMLPFDEDGGVAVDWLNGRRTPDANQALTASITGLSLGSNAPAVFRTIIESTCFGARAIIERFIQQGVPVKGLIGLGGVARKSPYIMQMLADITNMPIRIHRSEQTCALGAAMFAATAAGLYEKVEDAMQAMGQGFDRSYQPDPARVEIYNNKYKKYIALGEFTEYQLTSRANEKQQ